MRFNNRFMALMDIPDLPLGAFEHIGDRKIKPQGGGGTFPLTGAIDLNQIFPSGIGAMQSSIPIGAAPAPAPTIPAYQPGQTPRLLPNNPITISAADQTASQVDASIRPFLTQGLQQAQEIFLRQQPSFYPGQTYVDPSQASADALAIQEQIARSSNPTLQAAQGAFLQGLTQPSQATPLLQNIYGQAANQQGADVYGQAAYGGYVNPATRMAQNLYGQAGSQPGAQTYQQAASGQLGNMTTNQLSNIAGGQYLNSNPYQQQMMDAATRPITQAYSDQVLPGISSLYSKSGRLGSGAMERALGSATENYGRALGDVTSNLAGNQYQAERQLQQQALGQLSGVSAQDIANRLSGAQGLQSAQNQALTQQSGLISQLGNLSQQDVANRLTGATGLQAAQQAQLGTQLQAAQGLGTVQSTDLARQLQASLAAPQIYSQQYLPAQQLAQVGAQQEAIASQPLQEAMTRYAYEQRLPYEQLSGYLSSVYGSPLGSYGSPAQQLPQSNTTTNALSGALAGGLGGYALGQVFPSIGNYGGGYAAPLGGAALGGLLGGGFF